jgi:hypothetical protein
MKRTLKTVSMRAVAGLAFVGLLFAAAPMSADPFAAKCAAGSGSVAAIATTQIDPCDPLVDVFSTVGEFTEFAFGQGGVPPIPAGFFFPGSQPFSGPVALTGVQLGPGSGTADTAIRRAADPDFSSDSSSAALEVVGLSLSGALAVTGADGQVDAWLMAVNLASGPQPQGSYTARLDSPQGGTFSATLPVLPLLTFVREADVVAHQEGKIPASRIAVRSIDFSKQGFPPIVLQFQEVPFSTVPWVHDPCAQGSFFPGVLPGGIDSEVVSSGDPFDPVRHVFEPPPPPKKRCKYAHASSTASTTPPCRPNCPAGAAAPFLGVECTVVADCPEFRVRAVACAIQGSCAEVYALYECS